MTNLTYLCNGIYKYLLNIFQFQIMGKITDFQYKILDKRVTLISTLYQGPFQNLPQTNPLKELEM